MEGLDIGPLTIKKFNETSLVQKQFYGTDP